MEWFLSRKNFYYYNYHQRSQGEQVQGYGGDDDRRYAITLIVISTSASIVISTKTGSICKQGSQWNFDFMKQD